jgi:purine nucleosidase
MRSASVLLDTDIGSDIDDAVALAYLLRQPQCELVGISTVSGDVQKRAALAEAVCLASGRDNIPIHCGRREALFDGPGQPNVPQFKSIEKMNFRLNREENTAVDFLRNTIRQRPHEITLLSIGPLSNIALLFAIDPEIPFLLKSLVSMAGVFFQGERCEWNCICDPIATSMVYHTPRVEHFSIGLDVTEKCQMSAPEVKSRFIGEPLATVALLAEAWFEVRPEITFHDPLAAASIFNPNLLTYRSGQIASSPASPPGFTRFVEGSGPDRVAETTSSDEFFEEFFSVFK